LTVTFSCGLPPSLPVLVDTALSAYDVVWAAAGTGNAVFPTTYDELLRLTGGRAADVRKR
jgi:prolyl-tRNA editing enzyme YbaK/EbsC (Cys-tRNA(Pro) deacylase)